MDWSEAWVRGQANWQAFKRGRELSGALGPVRRRGGIVSGVFTEGRRKLRCVAREQDGLLSVECGCAANRTSGEICAHGVALVLAALAGEAGRVAEAGGSGAGVPEAELAEVEAGVQEAVACRIWLPPGGGARLAAGSLPIRLEKVRGEVDPADQRMAQFLAARGCGSSGVLNLQGQALAEALEALAGHPRVAQEGSGLPVRVEENLSLPLFESALHGQRVRLELSPGRTVVIPLEGEAGALVETSDGIRIGRLPVETPAGGWLDHLGELCRDGVLEIGLADFLDELDAWLDVFQSPAPGWLGRLCFKAAALECRARIEGSLSSLEAKLEWRYEGGCFAADPDRAAAGLPRIEGDHVWIRSRERESAWIRRWTAAGWESDAPGSLRLRDPQAVPLWLADELPELRRRGEVILGERLRHVMRNLHVVSPRIELATGDDLACEISFQTNDGKRLDPSKLREILRQGSRSLAMRNGATLVVRREVTDVVEPLLADLGLVSGAQRLSITKAQRFLFSRLSENRSENFDFENIKKNEPSFFKGLVRGELRPYQQQGVWWLGERLMELSGALLGDEMGLGKTIQTIALINLLKRKLESIRVLVLVPTSLIGNWEREFRVFGPDLKVCGFVGAGRDARRGEALSAEVLLTSYGTFQRDRAFHLANRFDLAVCDEASLLRNPDSELSRLVAKLPAERRLALSGTPVENRLEDLWSIFRFVAPGYLGSREEFASRDASEGGGVAERRRLALRISPYYLRRTKEEVAPELPEKLVIDEWLDLDDQARALYRGVAEAGLARFEEMGSGGAARMHLLTLLLRLRQICLWPRLVDRGHAGESVKMEWLRGLLEERRDAGGKTLVFSQFAGFLREFEALGGLPAEHVFRLDGSTRDRAGLVERFQACGGSALFLISLKAGGYGLNLTAADTVVHLDPWWNPAVENQATDRAHRIGQTRPVTVFRLLARDTVEERVLRIQERKRMLMEVAEGSDPATTGEGWSAEDLRSLVG